MSPIERSFKSRFPRLCGYMTVAALGVAVMSGAVSTASAETRDASAPCPPVASDTNDVSVASLYNGYCIQNNSPYALTRRSQVTDKGWGAAPPLTIAPGENAYFEVKYWWLQEDESFLEYVTPGNQVVTFVANQSRDLGVTSITDKSSCELRVTAAVCDMEPATWVGEQTRFRFRGIETDAVEVDGSPAAIVIDDTTGRTYVANSRSKSVSVIDTAQNTVIETIPLTGRLSEDISPIDLDLDRVAQRLYVASHDSPYFVVIDLLSGEQISHPQFQSQPKLAVDEVRHEVYRTNTYSAQVEVLNSNGAVIHEIPLDDVAGQAPFDIAIDTSLCRVYVSDPSQGRVRVIDAETKNVVADVPVVRATSTNALAVDTAAHKVYVTSESSKIMSIIDPLVDRVVRTVNTPGVPSDIAVDPATNHVYVASADNSSLAIFEGATFQERVQLPLFVPGAIAVDPADGSVVVAHRWGKALTRFDPTE